MYSNKFKVEYKVNEHCWPKNNTEIWLFSQRTINVWYHMNDDVR